MRVETRVPLNGQSAPNGRDEKCCIALGLCSCRTFRSWLDRAITPGTQDRLATIMPTNP